MKKLDLFWKTNKAWWTYNENLIPVLKKDAPPEARESYENYMAQKRNNK